MSRAIEHCAWWVSPADCPVGDWVYCVWRTACGARHEQISGKPDPRKDARCRFCGRPLANDLAALAEASD